MRLSRVTTRSNKVLGFGLPSLSRKNGEGDNCIYTIQISGNKNEHFTLDLTEPELSSIVSMGSDFLSRS